MPTDKLPQVPFGAVYFRKSNPPREDWERDYGVAAEDGLNIFRHWFMWGAIERAPGLLRLGRIRPPDRPCRQERHQDHRRRTDPHRARLGHAQIRPCAPDARRRRGRSPRTWASAAATGGFANNGGGAGALTLNCDEVKEAAGNFLTALATRYKGHPGLLGYDVWNECNYSPEVDYSAPMARRRSATGCGRNTATSIRWRAPGTATAMPNGTTSNRRTRWRRIPECLDWLAFKRDNYYGQMQFQIDTIRAIDKDCLIAAHGVAGAIPNMAANGCDDWLAASKVEVYGFTWIAARKGNQPWRNFFGGDLTRAASRGKPFWHAERQGGPLWMQPQVLGRDKEDGRVAEPEDVRLWTMTSFAAGARGVLNLRYRPLLDGPLFGAFGSYAMDGSRTPRSDMASAMAKWATRRSKSRSSRRARCAAISASWSCPRRRRSTICFNHEAVPTPTPAPCGAPIAASSTTASRRTGCISTTSTDYDALYFPYPIMLTEEHANRLTQLGGERRHAD